MAASRTNCAWPWNMWWGRNARVATICINAEDDVEQRRRDIERCIDEVNAGDGVILLTDMFGGTPSNLAISMMDRGGVEVIAGVNLPMLVKLAKTRSHQTLAECVGSAELAGRKYIAAASRVLTNNSSPNICRSLDPRRATPLNGPAAGCALPLAPEPARPFTPEPFIASSYKAGS